MCTGTPCIKSGSGQSVPVHPNMCTGTHVQKIDSGESVPIQCVPVHLHGNCVIGPETRSVREGTLVNEPKWENHIGGGYKSEMTEVKGSFGLIGFRF